MDLTDLKGYAYLHAVLNFAVLLAQMAALAWVWRRTGLTAVAANLAWRALSAVVTYAVPPLATLLPWLGVHLLPTQNLPYGSPPSLAWSLVSALLNAGLFAWLLVALVRRARPERMVGIEGIERRGAQGR